MEEQSYASDQSGRASSKREREFRKYAETTLGMRALPADEKAVSSRDIPLTAFAQLVALRLKSRRALISLFDKTQQYVLAEATQTLSLQHDHVHDSGDALFFGNTIVPRESDFVSEALKPARKQSAQRGGGRSDGSVIFPDLKDHQVFSAHPLVSAAPYARFYAAVPLLTPSGYAIGTLAVMDDDARPQGLLDVEASFMQDVASSIMLHLEFSRARDAGERGLRMAKGLSRFIEGKDSIHTQGSLRSQDNHRLLDSKTNGKSSARTQAMNLATNAERQVDAYNATTDSSETTSTRTLDHGLQSQTSSSRPQRRGQYDLPTRRKSAQNERSTRRSSSQDHANQLQEDVVSRDILQTFHRAANIVLQAMDMDGVIFLDASAGEFGSMRSHPTDDGSQTETDISSRSSSRSTVDSEDEPPFTDKSPHAKSCQYLAQAYQPSFIHDANVHRAVPERFLRSVMRRFPHGKIYNFDGNSCLLSSSDEFSDNAIPPDTTSADLAAARRRRRRKASSDGMNLLKIFPDCRSLGVIPMWDSRTSRFYAGAVVYSYNPQRLFSFNEDLNYLAAFCDVLMAEVNRLDIEVDARSKTTFISSISHELRSPLHGILGGVECLQEDVANPAYRREMIEMIDTCGRSLLDIVNNLLEHAHVDSSNKNKKDRLSPSKRRPRRLSNTSLDVHDLSSLTEEVLDSALWSTPQPTALASTTKDIAGQTSYLSVEPLKVALNLNTEHLPSTGWQFHVNAGAWRRVLQNLTTNSIKYTPRGGYFKVTLSILDDAPAAWNRTVVLECADSGQGMSEQYLQGGLWQAFNQEDSHAQGTGLGLSLVRSLVEGMGGKIQIQSSKGVGTSVKALLPLKAGSMPSEQTTDAELKPSLEKLTYVLVGFDTSDEGDTRERISSSVMRSSVESVCAALGLREAITSPARSVPDVYIVTELRALAVADAQSSNTESFQHKPCIVLCDSVASSRTTAAFCTGAMVRPQFVSQPLGPRRLRRALAACISDAVAQPQLRDSKDGIRSEQPFTATPTPADEVGTMSWTPTLESPNVDPWKAEKTNARSPTSSAQSAVLLVDDNSVNLALLGRYMDKLGRPQIRANNGKEALEAYEKSHKTTTGQVTDGQRPVTTIFMDITMPVMDGLEATREIRSFERANKITPAMIVALTAMASAQARQEAYGSGINLFLTKPVRFKEFEQMFKDWDKESEPQDKNEYGSS